jgi:hypothetical protein
VTRRSRRRSACPSSVADAAARPPRPPTGVSAGAIDGAAMVGLAGLPTLTAISINPLPNGPRADANGFGDGLQRLPARNLPYNPLSTTRRKPGILMDVHPVLPRIAEASQLQLPRPGPDGQPTESSQLAPDIDHGKSTQNHTDSTKWISDRCQRPQGYFGPHSKRTFLNLLYSILSRLFLPWRLDQLTSCRLRRCGTH